MAKKWHLKKMNNRESLILFLACTLISSDEDPGLRPIGAGEVLRRLVCKSIRKISINDIQCTAGGLQLYADKKLAVSYVYMR